MTSRVKNKTEEKIDSKVALKLRIKDLETEVLTLKQRLDSLRKAKNNTITKREREIIQVGEPGLGRPVGVETEKYRALEKKLIQTDNQRQQAESYAEKLKVEAELKHKEKCAAEKDKEEWKIICDRLEEKLKKYENKKEDHDHCNAKYRQKAAEVEDLNTELIRLREKLEVKATMEENKTAENTNREKYIEKLSTENGLLREKVETLYEELSLKEATWSDWKERSKKKTEEKWNEKYAQWISKTERKMKELQEANALLRGYFEKDKKVMDRKVSGFTEDDDEPGTSSSKD